MKKILSLVLVLSLVLGTFSFAFAATPEDVVDTDYEEAVETLMALGVVDGYPDGTYKPEKAVTRAEMAKLLIEALGYGELSAGAAASFSDAQGHWAESYIGFAASMDIVKGYPDGTFRPNDVMSTDEAITMVVRALGYTDEALKGTWPTNYKVKALDLELTDGLSSLSGDGLRGNVAMLLFNALEVKLVEVNSDGIAEVREDGKKFIDNIGTKVKDEFIDIDDVWGDDALDSVVDLEEYLFHTITYYENADGEVAYVSSVATDEFVGTVTANTGAKLTVEDVNEDEETFDIDEDTLLYYNGDEADATTADELLADNAEVIVVYDDDDVVQGIVAWEYKVEKIRNEYSVRTPLKLNGVAGWDLPENEDGDLDEDAVTVEGAAESLEEIEKDDVVYYYASNGLSKVKLLVVRSTDTGKLTELDAKKDTGLFSGTSYDLSIDTDLTWDTSDLGKTFDLILDKDGDVFAMSESDDEVTETYAIFISVADGDVETSDFEEEDFTVKTPARVKLFTSAGDEAVYDLDTSDIDVTTNTGINKVTFGSIEVDYNYSATPNNQTGELDASTTGTIGVGSLVRVEMNDDGEVTLVEYVDNGYKGTDYDSAEMELDGFDIVDSTIVFNVTTSIEDVDDWEVLEVDRLSSNLGHTNDLQYAYSGTTYNVLAMVIEDIGSDVYYALVDAESYWNGSKVVEKLTVYEAGEEKVYYTNADNMSDDKVEEIVEFSFSGDKVSTITTKAGMSITVSAVDSKRVTADDASDTVYNYADDFAVYLIEDGDWLIADYNDVQVDDIATLYRDAAGDVKVMVIDLDNQVVTEGDTSDDTTAINITYNSTTDAIEAEGLDKEDTYAVKITKALTSEPVETIEVNTTAGDGTTGQALITTGSYVTGQVYTAELLELGDLTTVLDSLNFIFK